jgi:hypothetical protein
MSDVNAVDVHRFMTTVFNVHLNPLIARFSHPISSFERVITGGVTEVRPLVFHPLASCAFFLEDFRADLYSEKTSWGSYDEVSRSLEPLLNFYAEKCCLVEQGERPLEECKELSECVVVPLFDFFKVVDAYFLGSLGLVERAIKLKTEYRIKRNTIVNHSVVTSKGNTVVSPLLSLPKKGAKRHFVSPIHETVVSPSLPPLPEKGVKHEANICDVDRGGILGFFRRVLDLNATMKSNVFLKDWETLTRDNKHGFLFVVPKRVYQDYDCQLRINNARSMKEVDSIVKNFYRVIVRK